MLFTSILDHPSTYKKDQSDVYGSIIALPAQIRAAWDDLANLKIPKSCQNVTSLVFVGMGGSALGGRVIEGLAFEHLHLPLTLVNDYHLPAFVGPKTLVVLSSYSGDTQEVVVASKQALEKKAQIFCLTTGGQLERLAAQNNLPAYIFTPKHNPSNQPRLAIGYNIISQMALLARCGHITLTDQHLDQVVSFLTQQQTTLDRQVPLKSNPAKSLALKIQSKALILLSSHHLTGAVHVFKNQLNENAKTFAARFDIPELNHHLLEGLSYPKILKDHFHFLLINSSLYPPPIQKRCLLTEEVIVKQGYHVTKIQPESADPLTQVFETIAFGSFVSYYLALLHGLDPAPIPWVDYFKARLKE